MARRETLGERTAELLERLFDPAAMLIAFPSPDEPTRPIPVIARGDPAPGADDPFLAAIAAARTLVRTDEPARLGAPLAAAGHTMGLLAVWGRRPRAYAAAAEPVMEAVAAQVALAVQNIRLLALLSAGKREWEEMADAIKPALCITDPGGTVRRVNRPFADLVGLPVTAIPGRACLTLFPPAWREVLERLLAHAGESEATEIRERQRLYSASAIAVEGEEEASLVLIIEDHTETRRLQEHLIQSEKLSAIGQLITGVAHELNSPLASILGLADALAEAGDLPPRLLEPLRVIQQEAQRAGGIVGNLLTFARRHEGDRRPQEVGPVLERTAALMHGQLLGRDIELVLEVEPGLPRVDCIAAQLQQVFVNLTNNAAQALAAAPPEGGGRITLRARRGDGGGGSGGVAVDVADNGPGVSAEIAERVFEPFFTTKAEGEGTGLGLAICQGIVGEHGGRITLRSEPGAGATFTVELPAAPSGS